MTVTVALVLGAFVCTILNAIGKCPLWVAVLLVVVIQFLQVYGR